MNSVAATAVAGRRPDRAVKVLLVVLALDVLFMLLHALHIVVPAYTSVVWLAGDGFGIDQERGAAELYQYAKLCLVLGGLLLWFVRDRVASALAWAAAFGYVLVDDAWQVHETLGSRLATGWALPTVPGLRAQDVGELLVWLAAGVVLGLAVLVTHRGSVGTERRTSTLLGASFALLIFCGLVLDAVHGAVSERFWLGPAMTLAEDGGELLAVSLVLFVVVSSRRTPAPSPSRAGLSGS